MSEKKKDIVDEVKKEVEKELKESLKPGIQTPPLPQFINVSNLKFIDISFELFREYVYPNGARLRIDFPLRLSIERNSTHRVFDASGLSYYIPSGWMFIDWKSKPGTPNFIM